MKSFILVPGGGTIKIVRSTELTYEADPPWERLASGLWQFRIGRAWAVAAKVAWALRVHHTPDLCHAYNCQ